MLSGSVGNAKPRDWKTFTSCSMAYELALVRGLATRFHPAGECRAVLLVSGSTLLAEIATSSDSISGGG